MYNIGFSFRFWILPATMTYFETRERYLYRYDKILDNTSLKISKTHSEGNLIQIMQIVIAKQSYSPIISYFQVIYWRALLQSAIWCLGKKLKFKLLRDLLQILLVTISELINFYSPWNHQKTYGFLMISGGTEVNQFA